MASCFSVTAFAKNNSCSWSGAQYHCAATRGGDSYFCRSNKYYWDSPLWCTEDQVKHSGKDCDVSGTSDSNECYVGGQLYGYADNSGTDGCAGDTSDGWYYDDHC